MIDHSIIDAMRTEAVVLQAGRDYDAVVSLVGNASIVLLGEATHGTHEFYGARMEITKRLLMGKGFGAIAVECDWPDALRVNRLI